MHFHRLRMSENFASWGKPAALWVAFRDCANWTQCVTWFIAVAAGVSPTVSRKGGTGGEILRLWKMNILELCSLCAVKCCCLLWHDLGVFMLTAESDAAFGSQRWVMLNIRHFWMLSDVPGTFWIAEWRKMERLCEKQRTAESKRGEEYPANNKNKEGWLDWLYLA